MKRTRSLPAIAMHAGVCGVRRDRLWQAGIYILIGVACDFQPRPPLSHCILSGKVLLGRPCEFRYVVSFVYTFL